MAEPHARPPAAGTRRRALAVQLSLAMTLVAGLAVLLAGLVSLSLVRGAAESQSLAALGQQAAVVANLSGPVAAPREIVRQNASRRLLTRQRIDVVAVSRAGVVRGRNAAVLAPADVSRLQAGEEFQAIRPSRDGRLLVAGHPLTAGGGVVLLQPAAVSRGITDSTLRRIGLALLVGLVGAAIAGALLARRLARPLVQAAGAAHRMAGGARDVQLPAAGPREVAEVSTALTALSAALATSEGRQREFLLSVSHELRTPLTAVKGYAEALADGVVPPGEVAATGATVRAESARLERLVSDLLDLARLDARDFRIDPGPVDLADLVREAGRVWQSRAAPAGVRLVVEVPPEPLVVRTDAARLRQILDGLAENALRVTPAGAPLVLAARRDGAEAVAEVRDGGPGLTPDDLAVAFERSALYDRYRGSRRVGTGIGLALVAGLARRLGGRAEAGTAAEGGARFSIRLPAGDQ